MINLDNNHLQQVRQILNEILPGYEIWAFGSRVHGKRLKPFSDLDLAIINPAASNQQIMQLMDAFTESDLPIKVDIIDWHNIDDTFREIIEQQHEAIV